MRHACISAAAMLSVAGVLLFTTDARAQDPGGTPSQPPPAAPPGPPAAAAPDPNANALPPVRPRERGDDDEEDELKHFALSINPLSLILTRIGINFEYML